MVFRASCAGTARECPLEAARCRLFRLSAGVGPPSCLPVAISPWQDRALFRAREICFRLGGEDFIALDEMPPPRPRGMHLRTYEMQLARLKAFEARHNLYMEKLISRFEKA